MLRNLARPLPGIEPGNQPDSDLIAARARQQRQPQRGAHRHAPLWVTRAAEQLTVQTAPEAAPQAPCLRGAPASVLANRWGAGSACFRSRVCAAQRLTTRGVPPGNPLCGLRPEPPPITGWSVGRADFVAAGP